MRFIGIDVGIAKTGVAVYDYSSGMIETHSVTSGTKNDTMVRQEQIIEGVKALLRPGDIVVFEEFGFGGRFGVSGKFVERVELLGRLKQVCLGATGMCYLGSSVQMLKKFVTLRGDSKKDKIEAMVKKAWGIPVSNDDEADACGLALLGAYTYTFLVHQLAQPAKNVAVAPPGGSPLVIPSHAKRTEVIHKFYKHNKVNWFRIRFVLPAVVTA